MSEQELQNKITELEELLEKTVYAARHYYVTFECDECDTTIKHLVADYTEREPDGLMEIPFDVAGQTEFECPNCGKKYYTGDVDYSAEDEM